MRDFLRPYEISIWNLQDGFISVLKPSDIELRGKGWIQDGQFSRKDDGIDTLSFSIPMYIDDDNGGKRENPIWYNVINGTLIANMRKLKLIFNKRQENEKVFEFLIVKVTERHSQDQLFCDIEAEGLAYHELGKKGYKISLSAEEFELDYENWEKTHNTNVIYGEDDEDDIIEEEPAPIANLQYWNDKIFKFSDGSWKYDWTYEVQMDHSLEFGEEVGDPTKIYEEAYVASWEIENDKVVASAAEDAKEKARTTFSISESNIYNATQEIAEAFGVFCRYEYEYDDKYHIVGKKVIYYNNFLAEAGEYIEDKTEGGETIGCYRGGLIDLTYPYNTNDITREMDSTELVTKLYVQSVEDDLTDAGTVSIMDVAANKTKEDYLLNFDYLYKIGGITQEQYDEIPVFEKEVRDINVQIETLQMLLAQWQKDLNRLSANIQNSNDQIVAYNEQISDLNTTIAAKGGADGTEDELTQIRLPNGACSLYCTKTKQRKKKYTAGNTGAVFLINEHAKGLTDKSYIRVYSSSDKTGRIKHIKHDNATGEIYNIPKKWIGNVLYVEYDVNLTLPENKTKEYCLTNLADEQRRVEQYQEEYDLIIEKQAEAQSRLETLLDEKNKLIINFEKMLGVAIREGYWNPDNYNDYGNRYEGQISILIKSANYLLQDRLKITNDNNGMLSFEWNNGYVDNLVNYWGEGDSGSGAPVEQRISFLEDEANSYYYATGVGVDTNDKSIVSPYAKYFYPCIRISDNTILQELSEHYDELSKYCIGFVRTDFDANLYGENNQYVLFPILSQCTFGFRPGNTYPNRYYPVLVLNTDGLSDEDVQEDIIKKTPLLLKITSEDTELAEYTIISNNGFSWFSDDPSTYPWPNMTNYKGEYYIYYPRIRINSLKLKKNTTGDKPDLMISLNNHILNDYEDYSINPYSRTIVDTNEQPQINDCEYITIKPLSILRYGLVKNKNGTTPRLSLLFNINYTISNADTAIYLDAIQVAKENSQPKVSYTINLNSLNRNLLATSYDLLGAVANINDTDLKFKNIQGYISEVILDLDKPQEDTANVKNYKNKFEDLFSKIVAETASMQKNAYTVGFAAEVLTTQGGLKGEAVQKSINMADLNYAFNNGHLTINETNGIIGESESGLVAYRGGGIFTANEKDVDGNWIWNTGILPSGINANLITAGQLDTNKIRIFGGTDLRFVWDENGIVAYEPIYDLNKEAIVGIDQHQYVKYNGSGLALTAEKGATYELDNISEDNIKAATLVFNKQDITDLLKEAVPESSTTVIQRVAVNTPFLELTYGQNNQLAFYADNTCIIGNQIVSWSFNNEDQLIIENQLSNINANEEFEFDINGNTVVLTRDQFLITESEVENMVLSLYHGNIYSLAVIETEEDENGDVISQQTTTTWGNWNVSNEEEIFNNLIIDNNNIINLDNGMWNISFDDNVFNIDSSLLGDYLYESVTTIIDAVVPLSQIDFNVSSATNVENNLITVSQISSKYAVKSSSVVVCYLNYKGVLSSFQILATDLNSSSSVAEKTVNGYTYSTTVSENTVMVEFSTTIINGKTTHIYDSDTPVKRVEIGWDGLTLRNWENEKVFYASPDSGDLTIKGIVYATGLFIGDQNKDIKDYVNNKQISGQYFVVDADSGVIAMNAEKTLTISGGLVNITGGNGINFYSGNINAQTNPIIRIDSSGFTANTGTNFIFKITNNKIAISDNTDAGEILTIDSSGIVTNKLRIDGSGQITKNLSVAGSLTSGDILSNGWIKAYDIAGNKRYVTVGDRRFCIQYTTKTAANYTPVDGNHTILIRRRKVSNSGSTSETTSISTKTYTATTPSTRIFKIYKNGDVINDPDETNMGLITPNMTQWAYKANFSASSATALTAGDSYKYELSFIVYNTKNESASQDVKNVVFEVATARNNNNVIWTTSKAYTVNRVSSQTITLSGTISSLPFATNSKSLTLYIRARSSGSTATNPQPATGQTSSSLCIQSSQTITLKLTSTVTQQTTTTATYAYDFEYYP